MERFFTIVFVIIICFLANSCIETIDLADRSNTEQYITINGQITSLNEPYVVTIAKSGTFNEYIEKISDADVKIIGSNGYIYQLEPTEAGRYETDQNQPPGIVGNTYFLMVTLNNGDIYQSAIEELLPVSPIEDITFEYVKEKELNEELNIVDRKRVKISVTNGIRDNSEITYYKWNVTGEYEFRESEALTDIFMFTNVGPVLLTCFVDDPIRLGEVYVFNTEEALGHEKFKQEIKSIDVDYKFAFNYCVHVQQESLSCEAYQFWTNVQEVTEREGGLFENTPGNITGNISNIDDPEEIVLGYFYASAVTEKKIFISADLVGNPVSPCYVIDDDFEAECMECLEIPNSRRGLPSYWPR